MTSIFNPEAFLNSTQSGGFSTKRPTVNDGEYPGQLMEGKDGFDIKVVPVDGKPRFILALGWELLSDTAREQTGLDKPRVKQDIWLDVEGGSLMRDRTHNVELGRFLEGVGLNSASGEWSPIQLRTLGVCKLKVVTDKQGYNKVTAAVRMG